MTTTPSGVSEELKEQGRSAQKRRAILDAATEVFLQKGYLATNMDEIAALAAVSEQNVSKNFSGQATLFVEVVGNATNTGSDQGRWEIPALPHCEQNYGRLYR